MKTPLHILLSLFFLCAGLAAQGSSTGSSQLNLPLTARAASLAGALVADGGSYSSSVVNPANLWTTGTATVLVSHAQWIQDIQTEHAGAQVPFPFGTFGLTISNTNIRGIEIRDQPGPPIGTFTARFATVQAGFASPVSPDLIVGGALKYLYEKLYVDEATGIGVDLGVLYRTPVEGLSAAVSITNLGELGKFRSEPSRLPSLARFGGQYRIALGDFRVATHLGLSTAVYGSTTRSQLGIEVFYDQLLVLRLGYESGYESRGLAGGLGIRYRFVQLDYGYVPFSQGLGDAHLLTIGFEL